MQKEETTKKGFFGKFKKEKTEVNDSDVEATGVKVEDRLPTGLTLVTATPSQGTFAAGVWNVGTVAARATLTLTLAVTVD